MLCQDFRGQVFGLRSCRFYGFTHCRLKNFLRHFIPKRINGNYFTGIFLSAGSFIYRIYHFLFACFGVYFSKKYIIVAFFENVFNKFVVVPCNRHYTAFVADRHRVYRHTLVYPFFGHGSKDVTSYKYIAAGENVRYQYRLASVLVISRIISY